ncbi:hypothetical protein RvVAT039_pl06690 (plasmid) [Agrobacterium vitis]|nr:hypothetical protein RvVAT039_pl06690 [Agrobacterium vitis]
MFPADLIEIDRTSELWVKKKSANPDGVMLPKERLGLSLIVPALVLLEHSRICCENRSVKLCGE